MRALVTRGALTAAVFVGILGYALPAAANSPTAIAFSITFDDVNPCTGLVHTVTISGTSWVHEHDSRVVVRSERVITTSTGFLGRGTDSFVANGQIETLELNDVLTHESGDRIRAHLVILFDLSTSTVVVFTGSLTCIPG